MVQTKSFFIMLLVSSSFTFLIEASLRQRNHCGPEPKVMQVDLTKQCTFCRENLSVKKAAITFAYCGHSYHTLCYDRMVQNNKNQKCYCSSPLVNYDADVIEEIAANERDEDCIEKAVYFCAKAEISVLKELSDILEELPRHGVIIVDESL